MQSFKSFTSRIRCSDLRLSQQPVIREYPFQTCLKERNPLTVTALHPTHPTPPLHLPLLCAIFTCTHYVRLWPVTQRRVDNSSRPDMFQDNNNFPENQEQKKKHLTLLSGGEKHKHINLPIIDLIRHFCRPKPRWISVSSSQVTIMYVAHLITNKCFTIIAN